MRIRTIKNIVYQGSVYPTGSELEIPDPDGLRLVKFGEAEELKRSPGPGDLPAPETPEAAAIEPQEKKVTRRPKRRG